MNVMAHPPKQPGPRPPPSPKRAREDYEFLPAALEILETPASPVRVAVLWFICCLATATLVWTWVGTFDIVATAQGKIQPTGRIKVIQSSETGRTITTAAENGATVKAGDVLVELDATEIMAEETATAMTLSAWRAEAARRAAVLQVVRIGSFSTQARADGAEALLAIAFPDDVSERIRQREVMQYKADMDQLDSSLSSLDAQSAQHEAEIGRLESTIKARKALVATLSERVGMRSTLVDAQAGTRASLLDATEVRQKEETELVEQEGLLAETRAKILVVTRDAKRQISTFVAENATKLSEAQRQIDELEQNLIRARKRHQNMIIRSPVSGTIQASAMTTIGQVVSAGTELMRVVPSGTSLEIEAYLPNRDIGFVHAGQEAVIKVEAFPFTRYGTITGKVVRIATDAIPEPDAQLTEQSSARDLQSIVPTGNAQRMQNLVFPVTIRLDASSLDVDGRAVPLSPGMAATVEMKTGKRRILEYLFSPLAEISSQSMMER